MSSFERILTSVPLQVREAKGMVEANGEMLWIRYAEMWILDEYHPDGFRVLCGLDLNTGALYGSTGIAWSA